MTQPRRTLEGALLTPEVTPEAVAIIKEGTPKPQSAVVLSVPTAKPAQSAVAKPGREPEAVRPRAEKARGPDVLPIVSLTVRVPANIPQVLLKAASERKLKKAKPYTQQDIVSEALSDWLRKNGYVV